MERELAVKSITEADWPSLLEKDQLRCQMDAEKVFKGWQEAKIDFAPTYKYDYGSDVYDSSEKARIPAWCDRVLWQVNKNGGLNLGIKNRNKKVENQFCAIDPLQFFIANTF